MRRRGWIPEDLFLLNAVRWGVLVGAPLAAAGAALAVSEVDTRLARLLDLAGWAPPLSLEQGLIQVQLVTDGAGLAATLGAVVLVPAVCEEVFFRGFVFTGLRYHYGPLTAVIGSSLIFAAAHLNPWQFPALFLLGLFLGLLVLWAHSVYPALIAHAVNNLLSVVAVNLRVHTGVDYLGADQPLPLPSLAAAALALLLGLRLMRRSRPLMPLISPYSRPAPADKVPFGSVWS